MSFVTEHPINARWPAENPEILQLYSFPTPNGIKVSAMLEETGLEYEWHRVPLSDADVKSPEFLSLNPNGKIPAIIDPQGPGGKPLALFESGAILIYLAKKTGMFMSGDPVKRYETIQWVMFQMGGVGPMFGQLGYFFKFAGADIEEVGPVGDLNRDGGVPPVGIQKRSAGAEHRDFHVFQRANSPYLDDF